MKATVDVPDQLYRRVKARAALEGRAVRDVTIELYERWLTDERVTQPPDQEAAAADWIARWQTLGDEIESAAIDPRSTLQILLDDRR